MKLLRSFCLPIIFAFATSQSSAMESAYVKDFFCRHISSYKQIIESEAMDIDSRLISLYIVSYVKPIQEGQYIQSFCSNLENRLNLNDRVHVAYMARIYAALGQAKECREYLERLQPGGLQIDLSTLNFNQIWDITEKEFYCPGL